MRHTIALTEDSERALRKIAEQCGQSADQALAMIAEALLTSETTDITVGYEGGSIRIHAADQSNLPIRSTSDVMDGDACFRNTRVPVSLLVQFKQFGYSDDRILANYPRLTASDLVATWDFYAANAERVESERRSHEAAA